MDITIAKLYNIFVHLHNKYASVAQGIERRFPKPCVGCSNHLGGTKIKPQVKDPGFYFGVLN